MPPDAPHYAAGMVKKRPMREENSQCQQIHEMGDLKRYRSLPKAGLPAPEDCFSYRHCEKAQPTTQSRKLAVWGTFLWIATLRSQ
jgi:hypothetical protein